MDIQVDALDKSLSKVTMKIRTMKNALAPANRLPVEILQQIPSWLAYVSDIIATSQVCRYWRLAALSCPSLWTFLDCKSTPATRAFIERSGVVPLDICIRPGFSPEAFVFTIPHIQRWGSLDALVTGEEITPVMATLSALNSAPKLCTLSIVPMIGYNGGFVASKGKILGGVIPSLRRLYFSSLKIDIHGLTAPNLTHLFLASTHSQFIDMITLLGFLERSPLLEEFELRYPGPREGDIAHPDHVVSLNHLRRIILWDRGVIFLNHLVLPHGIECELNPLFVDVSATTGFLEEMFGEPPERLKPIFGAESLSIVPHFARGAVRFLGPSGFLEIIPTFVHTANTSATRFINYPRSVLKKVKDLFVGSRGGVMPGWGSTDIRNHLNKMPSLESLTIMHCNHAPFIEALLPAGELPCPTLKNLTIYIGSTEGFSIPTFRSMVEQRGLHGHKFEKMVLVLGYEHRIEPAIPNLETRVDDRPLHWDSKKKIWRYLNEGEVYLEDSRSLALPDIMPLDPLLPPIHLPV